MKKIHITESQLKELKKRINEGVTNIDVTNDFQNDGKTYGPNVKKTIASAKQNGLSTDEMNVSVNGSALDENFKKYTKRQIKEARLKKLIANSNKMTTKKNF